MSLQKATVEKPSVRFWISESTVTGGDGLRNAGVISIASELADLVNQAYVNRLRSATVAANAFELAVPAPQLFGDPITLPPSGALDSNTLRTAFYGTFPPRGEWTLAVRHHIEYNVFSDTVELQLTSVVTVLQADGSPYWQNSARSQKYFDNWGSGEQLAELSAHFVAEAVAENAKQLQAAPRMVNLTKR